MRRKIWILVIGLSVGGAGCASAVRQSRLMQEQGAKGMTAAELELVVQDFTLRYGGEIEETAYRILAARPDPLVRLAVLRWRYYAFQAFQKPLFRPDPFVAVVDAWLLAEQMIQYYQEGAGRGTLGDYETPIVETCTKLRQELGQLFTRAAGGPSSKGLDLAWAEEWTRAHPLRSHLFVRESVVPEAARTLAAGGTDIGGILVTTETALRSTNTRVTFLVEMMPRMVAWQIELATIEAMIDPASGTVTLENLVPLTDYLVRMEGIADDQMKTAFENLERLRADAFVDLQREREATLAGIGAERKAAFTDLAGERQALVDAVASQRALIVDAVRAEMQAAVARLTEERKAALAQVGAIAVKSVGDAGAVSAALVDRLFWRLLVLVATIFAGLIVYRVVTDRSAGRHPGSA